jgi:hypothetical protein
VWSSSLQVNQSSRKLLGHQEEGGLKMCKRPGGAFPETSPGVKTLPPAHHGTQSALGVPGVGAPGPPAIAGL